MKVFKFKLQRIKQKKPSIFELNNTATIFQNTHKPYI